MCPMQLGQAQRTTARSRTEQRGAAATSSHTRHLFAK